MLITAPEAPSVDQTAASIVTVLAVGVPQLNAPVMTNRKKTWQGLLTAVAVLLSTACSTSIKLGPESVAGLAPDATIDMQQVQVAYLASGGGGSGTLYYNGAAYPFTVAGLGIGGIGASTISASGEVYKLSSLAQFQGTYGQARYGFALGTDSAGDLWLQNEAGVILHLKAKREGLMLSLGGDAVVISME